MSDISGPHAIPQPMSYQSPPQRPTAPWWLAAVVAIGVPAVLGLIGYGALGARVDSVEAAQAAKADKALVDELMAENRRQHERLFLLVEKVADKVGAVKP